MLNRLFIAIGVFAILALVAAYVVPGFWPWANSRDAIEARATELFGVPVRVEGDIAFSLLPTPRLRLSGVSVGAPESPDIDVIGVEAEFALFDLLRDQFRVTRLHLERPAVRIRLTKGGNVVMAMPVARDGPDPRISISGATLSRGSILVKDERTDTAYRIEDVRADVSIEALGGAMSLSGEGRYEDKPYTARLTAGRPAADGTTPLALSLRPADGGFSVQLDGRVDRADGARFDGALTYRQTPPAPAEGEPEDTGRGDLMLASRLVASATELQFLEYTLLPDQNRTTSRLTGDAKVTLGGAPEFDVEVHGGTVALPVRDATVESGTRTYELVRLLGELPLPPAPAMPGRLRADMAELGLRDFSLREVKLDAQYRDGGWSVDEFTGLLPGSTRVRLAGAVDTATGKPEFSGQLDVTSTRLDALSMLWRKPEPGNPLFNMPGSLSAKLDLVGETLSLSEGSFVLDGETRPITAQMGFGDFPDLHLTLDLGSLDDTRSAALFAFLPDLTRDPEFSATFVKGEFEITADRLNLDGLVGTKLGARGTWDGGVLVIEEALAEDLGGAAIALQATVFGTLEQPEVSGKGTISVAARNAPVLAWLERRLGASGGVAAAARRMLPAEIELSLGAPSDTGAQDVGFTGTLGATRLTGGGRTSVGFLRAFSDRIDLQFDLRSDDADAMSAQFGVGPTAPIGVEGPMHLVAQFDGNIANSLETQLRLERGSESLGFSGHLVVSNPDRLSGTGVVRAMLQDTERLLGLAGLPGLTVPPFAAQANVAFEGPGQLRFTDIAGTSGSGAFTGDLRLDDTPATPAVTGTLDLPRLDLDATLQLVGGRLAPVRLMPDSRWPDAPLELGLTTRRTTGKLAITAPGIDSAGAPLLGETAFGLDWDATSVRLREGNAALGEGSVQFDITLCCAGQAAGVQASGTAGITGVALDTLLPPASADALDGRLTASAQFSAGGDGLAGLINGAAGEGAWTVTDFRIERLDAGATGALGALETIIGQEPDALNALLVDRLDDAPFTAPEVSGSFSVGGGVLRSANIAVPGEGGALFGSFTVSLNDLAVDADYALTATAPVAPPLPEVPAAPASDPAAVPAIPLAPESLPGIEITVGGTLESPTREFDASALIDAIMVRAFEAEVQRLEALRAADEARTQAQAEEDAAREAARQAAAAEAARQEAAAAEERRRAAEAARRAEEARRPLDLGLGN